MIDDLEGSAYPSEGQFFLAPRGGSLASGIVKNESELVEAKTCFPTAKRKSF
jgi:hypothetical protein